MTWPQAGVGVGTVYRRFPDKASLAGALFEERLDTLADMTERARDQPDAWAALVSFLKHGTAMLADDRGLRQILMFAAQGHDCAISAWSRIRPAIDSLVKRAQADGQVRAHLAATDIPIIEFMLAAVAEYTRKVRPARWRRFLPLMLDALRPSRGTATPLAEAEVSADEMVEILSSNQVSWHLARPSPVGVTAEPAGLGGDQVIGEQRDGGEERRHGQCRCWPRTHRPHHMSYVPYSPRRPPSPVAEAVRVGTGTTPRIDGQTILPGRNSGERGERTVFERGVLIAPRYPPEERQAALGKTRQRCACSVVPGRLPELST